MDRRVPKRLLWTCRFILQAASLLVPRRQRAEWIREWNAEVWHWAHFLVESERLSPRTEEELLRHCWGAFPDALWHRLNRVAVLNFVHEYPRTPAFCLMVLLVALSIFAGHNLPRSTLWLRPSLAVNTSDLLTVSLSSHSHWLEPEVLRDEADEWRRTSPIISQAAAYAWRRSVIRGPVGKEEILSARVTPGIFHLLGAAPILGRIFDPADALSCANCVVVSQAIWWSQFHESQDIIGKHLALNGGQVEIVGVLPAQFRLPGIDVAVFTLFGAGTQPRLPGLEWPGALLRIRAGTPIRTAQRQLDALVNQDSDVPPYATLDVLSLKDIQYQWLESWFAFGGLAILLLAALNWRRVAQLCMSGPRGAAEMMRWWLFFAAKNSLLVTIALVVALDVARTTALKFSPTAQGYAEAIAIWVFTVGLTFALSWSLRDQLSRCRTCLKRLTTRIDFGGPAALLCEPSGVEFVCDAGHGALHVPTLPLSSLDSDSWTDLDESWREIGQAQLGARA